MTRLIKQINFPADLRKFKKDQLKKHGKNAKDLTNTIEFILGRNF